MLCAVVEAGRWTASEAFTGRTHHQNITSSPNTCIGIGCTNKIAAGLVDRRRLGTATPCSNRTDTKAMIHATVQAEGWGVDNCHRGMSDGVANRVPAAASWRNHVDCSHPVLIYGSNGLLWAVVMLVWVTAAHPEACSGWLAVVVGDWCVCYY